MRVGQRVQWQSQGGGSATIKVGTIVRIVIDMENPHKVSQKEFPSHKYMFGGFKIPGGKTAKYAYFVEVIKSPRAKPRLYMPFPHKLMIY